MNGFSGVHHELKSSESQLFYASGRWKKMARAVLRRDSYQCQESKRFGKLVPAEIVHHIFPREEFPEYELEAWNLVSLSRRAHREVHEEDGTLSPKGIDLLRRTARRNGIPLPDQYAQPVPRQPVLRCRKGSLR